MQPEEAEPLIVTLRLDAQSSQFFDRERQRYFPPGRNFLASHITLFHKFARSREGEVREALHECAAGMKAFPIAVAGLRFLGRGVAYELASDDLFELRAVLAKRLGDVSPQDAQGFRPHVTVQNKVAPEEARALMETLCAGFSPWSAQGIGIDLWAYKGGPWAPLGTFPFQQDRHQGQA